MEKIKTLMIICPHCHQKAPLKIEKIFDDSFNCVGDKKLCSFCKLEFKAEDDIPFVEQKAQRIFDPNAERYFCKYCKNYAVNPWTQKCTLWNKEVTATDTCEKFAKRKTV